MTGQVVVLALLFGLFAMHGLPSGQAGCHGGTDLSAGPAMTGMPATTSTPGALAAPSAATASMASMASMADSCVALRPAGWPDHSLPLAFALGLLAVLLARPARLTASVPGRPPPRSGVSLLRWMGVSRT